MNSEHEDNLQLSDSGEPADGPAPPQRRRRWRDRLFRPQVSEEKLEECLDRLRQQLPTPVFWLLGKTQSGKTSIIRALTGSSRAEIGSGFRPCTRTSAIYPFPDEVDCFVKFLDTRGLGEANYDPGEDMQVSANQAHLLIVVVKAMDHAQQCVLEPLQKIREAHPEWPIIVVQTALHEGYPSGGWRHAEPYPFDKYPYGHQVPQDLARSLAHQRQWFEELPVTFVPVDFTQPEDGLVPEDYGVDALWSAIEQALPMGLRGMLQSAAARQPLRDVYFATAHPHILSYAVAAGASAAVPVPMLDLPLVLAIQAKMFQAIASIYGQKLGPQRFAEILGALGVGFLVRQGGRELLKFVPILGSTVSALYAAASTYAMGRTLCTYFSRVLDGDIPDPAVLRKSYEEEYAEGRRRLRAYLQNISRAQPKAE